MKTDDVLKAIEICTCAPRCSGCPYFNTPHKDCVDALLLDSRDLIKRQKTEIERLKMKTDKLMLEMSYMKSPNTIGDAHEMGAW